MFKIEIKLMENKETKDSCNLVITPTVNKNTTKNEKVTGVVILQEINKVIKKLS